MSHRLKLLYHSQVKQKQKHRKTFPCLPHPSISLQRALQRRSFHRYSLSEQQIIHINKFVIHGKRCSIKQHIQNTVFKFISVKINDNKNAEVNIPTVKFDMTKYPAGVKSCRDNASRCAALCGGRKAHVDQQK